MIVYHKVLGDKTYCVPRCSKVWVMSFYLPWNSPLAFAISVMSVTPVVPALSIQEGIPGWPAFASSVWSNGLIMVGGVWRHQEPLISTLPRVLPTLSLLVAHYAETIQAFGVTTQSGTKAAGYEKCARDLHVGQWSSWSARWTMKTPRLIQTVHNAVK